MDQALATQLAQWIEQETGVVPNVEPKEFEPGYWIIVETDRCLFGIRSWLDWHARKERVMKYLGIGEAA